MPFLFRRTPQTTSPDEFADRLKRIEQLAKDVEALNGEIAEKQEAKEAAEAEKQKALVGGFKQSALPPSTGQKNEEPADAEHENGHQEDDQHAQAAEATHIDSGSVEDVV